MSSPTFPGVNAPHFVPLTSGLLDGLEPVLTYTWVGVASLLLFVVYSSTRPKKSYDSIPAIGRTGFFSSYLDAIQYVKHSQEFLMEGYAKYRYGLFRVPEKTYWHVIVSGPQLIDDLRRAPDDVLSFAEATNAVLSINWTLGHNLGSNPYHLPIVRSRLTRNIGNVFSDLHEEIVHAFRDIIPPTESWTKVDASTDVLQITCRASNRIFVGAPLCRDPEFLGVCIRLTGDIVNSGTIMSFFPDFLKPIAGRLLTTAPKAIRIALKHLKPIIEERMRQIEEYGLDYPGKPDDMLSWLIDDARGEERTPENLTRRLLALNFVALHTSSASFTGALFNLASRPDYIQPIRDEVEAAIAEEGWTKAALNRMRKLDSFLKESQRINGLGLVSMVRIALKDFTFSNGTRLPKGAMVSAVSTLRHLDEEVYPDAKTFKGFRFSDMREGEGEGAMNQMVATSLDFLPFGHGKHACPGRFFAVTELKAMLAHVVLEYNLKMTDTPRYMYFGAAISPDTDAGVWFRKRRV